MGNGRLVSCFVVAGLSWALAASSPARPASPGSASPVERAIATGETAFEHKDYARALAAWLPIVPILLKVGDERAADLLYVTGIAYRETSDFARALDAFDRALRLHGALGARSREAGDLSAAGGVLERLGRNADALADYDRAIAIDRAEKDGEALADDLGRSARVERMLARYPDALQRIREALLIDPAIHDQAGEAAHRGELGNVLNAIGRYDEALTEQQHALDMHRALKDRSGEATDLGNVANAQENLGRYDDALALDRQALAIDRSERNRAGEASDLGNIGNLERDLGQYADALASHQQALAIHRALRDGLEEAADLGNIGGVEQELGRYDDALIHYRTALSIDGGGKNPRGEAGALANIGNVEDMLGGYAEALDSDRRALVIHRTIGDRPGEADDLGNIGSVLSDMGRYAEARDSYERALGIEREIKDRLGEAGTLANIGNVDENLDRADDGLAAYESALAIHREIKSALGEANDLSNIGTTDDVLGRYADARAAAADAVAIAAKLAVPEYLWRALAAEAYADAHLDRRDQALAEYDAALERIEALRAGLSDGERSGFFGGKLFLYDEYVSYLLELDGKFPGKGYDRKALEILERRSARAVLEEIGESAAHHFRGVDAKVIAAEDDAGAALDRAETRRSRLLTKSAADQSAAAAAEREVASAKARLATLEADVRARYPAYFELRHPQPLAAQCTAPCPSIEGFQRTVLRPGELVLAYDLLEPHSALWLIERDRVQLLPLASGKDLDAAVSRLGAHVAGLVASGSRGSRFERSAAADIPAFAADSFALYRMLVPDAAASAIARAKSLIVVPSGSLYRLAFETLVTTDPAQSAQPHYLIRDVPVSYVPSASLLALVRGSYAQPAAGRSPLLAFADPSFGADASGGTRGLAPTSALQLNAVRSAFAGAVFPALPGTRVEAEAVRKALGAPAASLVAGEQATRERVLAFDERDTLKTYQYVLFATHAVLPSEIKGLTQPAIVLAHPERGGGLLTMADVFGLTLDADLVTLSACNTGVETADSSGEGISGLTRAFLYAGTPAISVTLWQVDDAAAPQITPRFFAGMHAEKLSPAAALRAAKLVLLDSPQARFRHPYAWGPSVIFGDGGPR